MAEYNVSVAANHPMCGVYWIEAESLEAAVEQAKLHAAADFEGQGIEYEYIRRSAVSDQRIVSVMTDDENEVWYPEDSNG